MKRLLETGHHDRNNSFQREPKISRRHEGVTFRANKHTRLIAKAKLSDTSRGQHVENKHGE